MLRSRRPVALFGAVLFAATVLTSCTAGDPVTAPSTPGATVVDSAAMAELRLPILGPLLEGLLVCRRQDYAVTTRTIGPAGGTIRVGGHVLEIPRGALRQYVQITAEAPADYVASVRFQPEGLQFDRAATLTLDYSDCPAARLNLLKRVAYTTDDLNILSFLLSRDNILLMRVSADLHHFSRYAVAW